VSGGQALPAGLDALTEEQAAAIKSKGEVFGFQAEVSRLMKLIVNSLYKNKEIFLRELISNASDALDKIRFLSLTDRNALGSKPELRIDVRTDSNAKVGGGSRWSGQWWWWWWWWWQPAADRGSFGTDCHDHRHWRWHDQEGPRDQPRHRGQVGHRRLYGKGGAGRGRARALERQGRTADRTGQQSQDLGLIGQFGVGFYSAFLVADRVTVISKHNDDDQHIWESNAEGEFTVVKDPRGNTLGRGTQIMCVPWPWRAAGACSRCVTVRGEGGGTVCT
jgi:heat shock protein 90kDa beta